MTRRLHVDVPAPALGGAGTVIVYGHYGRPFLVFPSEQGRAWDFENNGMVDAVGRLLDAGRVQAVLRGHRRRRHLVRPLAADRGAGPPARRVRGLGRRRGACRASGDDCGGRRGDRHDRRLRGRTTRLNFALRQADVFPLAIGLSGNYDPSAWHGWGEQGDATYFNNPIDYVPEPAAATTSTGCGRGCQPAARRRAGAWEDTTGRAAESHPALAELLQEKGIRRELDLWGYDVPHDWPSWQRAVRAPPAAVLLIEEAHAPEATAPST